MGLSESTVKAIAIGATVVALGAAGVAVYFYATSAGDEPPIRVKGGSIEMDLIHSRKKFEKPNNSNKKEWKISSGSRKRGAYLVYIGLNDPKTCGDQQRLVWSGTTVDFVHENGKKVTFLADSDKQTRITSSEDMDTVQNSNNRKLSYAAAGRIASIVIDGTTVCTITTAAQLNSVLLTEDTDAPEE